MTTNALDDGPLASVHKKLALLLAGGPRGCRKRDRSISSTGRIAGAVAVGTLLSVGRARVLSPPVTARERAS